MTEWIRASTFHQQQGAEDWRVVGDGACTFVPTRSLTEAARLVQAIADLPGMDEEPPDIDVRSGGVTVRLVTRSADGYGMSQRDLDRARRISGAARQLDLAPDPTVVQNLLVIVGSQATPEVMPFWQAVLGYVPRPDSPAEDLVDPDILLFKDAQPNLQGAKRREQMRTHEVRKCETALRGTDEQRAPFPQVCDVLP